MEHRGPDESGVYTAKNVGFGVRRLSTFGVPGGHQPIANENGTVVVAFNGEICNQRAARPTRNRMGSPHDQEHAG